MICTVESVGKTSSRYTQVRMRRPWQGREIIPGQYVKIHVSTMPAYLSVVNYQDSDRHFDLLIAPGGNTAIKALIACQPGDEFDVSDVSGAGYPEPLRDGYFLLAGGSGIASIVPIVEWSALNNIPCRTVYYDREGQAVYTDFLHAISEPSHFSFWNTTFLGRPKDPLAMYGNLDFENVRLCVCGPDTLTRAVSDSLVSRGINPALACKNY